MTLSSVNMVFSCTYPEDVHSDPEEVYPDPEAWYVEAGCDSDARNVGTFTLESWHFHVE
jgi:hypothetical protein